MGHDRDPHNQDDLEHKIFGICYPLKNSFQTNIFSFDLDFEQLIKCHDIILYRHAEKGVGTNHFSVHLQQLILKYKIQQLVAVRPPKHFVFPSEFLPPEHSSTFIVSI